MALLALQIASIQSHKDSHIGHGLAQLFRLPFPPCWVFSLVFRMIYLKDHDEFTVVVLMCLARSKSVCYLLTNMHALWLFHFFWRRKGVRSLKKGVKQFPLPIRLTALELSWRHFEVIRDILWSLCYFICTERCYVWVESFLLHV